MGDEQKVVVETNAVDNENAAVPSETGDGNKPVEVTRSEQILKAKELYSHGSRNFLVKSYAEAAEELSEVCRIYDDLYGNLSDELGMPYLLYAKSLIALALDENKVIDVPDEEEEDDDDDDEDEEDEAAEGGANGEATTSTSPAKTNGSQKPLATISEEETKPEKEKKSDEADSTEDSAPSTKEDKPKETQEKSALNGSEEEAAVTSTDGEAEKEVPKPQNGQSKALDDDEKPSTSKGQTENGDSEDVDAAENDDEEDATSNLQLAWEVLELADKIFSRQGINGLPNLAEVKTELANISFENNALETARSDYEKALRIYDDLPNNYRRAKAEIHYKIGLTFLMQQSNKEGADSLKRACSLIDEEIEDIKSKEEQTEKEKNTIQDLEETKQEIWVKIAEIEETEAQTVAEVRAALDNYIKPFGETSNSSEAGPSSSTSAVTSSSSSSTSGKPTDISHLIKRKKLDESHEDAEEAVAPSPAKRPALAEN